MILSTVRQACQSDIGTSRHIQNNTICELAEVVVLWFGENVEKPEKLYGD